MTKRKSIKSPQAPAGTWRYDCVKRVYRTVLPSGKQFQETSYELAEVFDQGRSWSAEAGTVTASSRKDLIETLNKIIKDIEKYDVIVEPKPIVHKVGS